MTILISAKDIRRAYNRGKALGQVDVSSLGLTYFGQPIKALSFLRFGDVEIEMADGKKHGPWIDGGCYLDD